MTLELAELVHGCVLAYGSCLCVGMVRKCQPRAASTGSRGGQGGHIRWGESGLVRWLTWGEG